MTELRNLIPAIALLLVLGGIGWAVALESVYLADQARTFRVPNIRAWALGVGALAMLAFAGMAALGLSLF